MPKNPPTQTSSLISNIRQDVQSLVQVIPALVMVLDTYGVVITANETVGNLLGEKPEDMAGKGIYEMWPAAAPVFRERIQYVVKTELPDSFEASYEQRQVNVYLYPISDGKKVSSLLVFGQDITERSRFERQVQELTNQLESKVLERTSKLHLEQRRQELLARSSILLMQNPSPLPVFQAIAQDVSTLTSGLCAIVTLSPNRESFVIQACCARRSGEDQPLDDLGLLGKTYSLGPNPIIKHIAGKGAFSAANLSVAEAQKLIPSYFWHLLPENGISSLHAQPLAVRDELLGVIFFVHNPPPDEPETLASFSESLATLLSLSLHNANLLGRLTDSQEELRGLSKQLVDVQESQFKYLAQELHDQVGQNMTAININLNLVRRQLDGTDSPEPVRVLDESITLLADTVNRMRNLMAEFRPPVLDNYGLTAALYWYAEQITERARLEIVINDHGLGAMRLPLPIETGLFRIAQEALTNVVKHAKAKQVQIELTDQGSSLQMSVQDDGVGLKQPALAGKDSQPHWGMTIMRERARSLGGALEVESPPKGGLRLVVRIPKGETA